MSGFANNIFFAVSILFEGVQVCQAHLCVACATIVTERAGGEIILTSGWAAPYFSPGSTGCNKNEVSSQYRADSPQGYVRALELESIQ